MAEIKTHVMQVSTAYINVSTFGFIFTARKFLEAARIVVAHESQQEDSKWHPVGKYLACHSIELSFKAFLTLKGTKRTDAENFRHRIVELLAETRKQNLEEFVKLTDQEIGEIEKASKYYEKHIFRYPNVPEMATAYPDDPDVAPLLSAAEKLVDGLYDPCKAA
ncbi:hypothetical protein [Bradyrhizobium sp. JYMT SZCCT0428]|uniref:hypothetical protein n=1 Tax=Bradyrhizobium sp. JYMT SZCCT0428 TaxID=2807673 RepID=UPI001BA9F34D|nr:hypothetical protein [Bradyrhizobium sp. JYMT SZCCT0428]MBR1156206.1 hypothetical protein [Bradyrhizobium sp. JYMT SZCCT0428]